MRILALSTGTVRLKHSWLQAPRGWRRQVDMWLPGPFSAPLPIHCWVIEHGEQRILVDTGETSGVHDPPFARFQVAAEDELPAALAAEGLSVDQLDTVVLTHMHGDHMDGAVHVRRPVLVHAPELAFTRTRFARLAQRVLRQPVPQGVAFEPFTLDGGPFGGFESSRFLTADRRVVLVGTPGHTAGHVSVICVDDFGRHVLIAGDLTDTLEQLHALRPDPVSPSAAVAVETMRRVLAHAREHVTVYLPAHDPESAARLHAHTALQVQ
jgi:glyoxylase-like metal-dependent hydrolase (beta-lactamase superfamily II)